MALPSNISRLVLGFIIEVSKHHESSGNVDYFNNNTRLHRVMGFSYENNTIVSDSGGANNLTDRVDLLMPTWAYHSVAAYLLFISVVGIIMNITVAVVILKDSRMTPLNWMLLNLAFSDGAIAGFGTPVSTAAALQFGWPFSDDMCIAYAMIMSTAGIGSITTLTVLAVWRYQLVVCCPAKHKSTFANHSSRLDCRHGVLLLTFIWIYALAVTCPPLLGWGRYDREAAQISCSVNWESKRLYNRSYIFYMFIMGLVIPLVLIMVSYVKILRVVRERRRRAEIRRKTMLEPLEGSGHIVQYHGQLLAEHQRSITNKDEQQRLNNDQQHHHHRGDAAEKRVTMMVACMIAAFMGAWTPYSILALFETFSSVGSRDNDIGNKSNDSSASEVDDSIYVGIVSPAFATIPSLFAKTSAVLNPLIYGLLSTQFRLAWERFSLRFFPRRQQQRGTTVGVKSSPEKKIKIPNMRRFRISFSSDSKGLKAASTTVHLPMKEIILPNEVTTKNQANNGSSVVNIAKVPASITDAETSSSLSVPNVNQEGEQRQPRHNHQKQGKTIECQHYQSFRLPALLPKSIPLRSACTLSNLVCPEVEVTCQPIKERSIDIQPREEHPLSLMSVRLFCHIRADCNYSIGKSIFSNASPDAHASPPARITSVKNHSEVDPN